MKLHKWECSCGYTDHRVYYGMKSANRAFHTHVAESPINISEHEATFHVQPKLAEISVADKKQFGCTGGRIYE